MLRIDELENIPLNAIIVCASCEWSVYVVVRSPNNQRNTIQSLTRRFGIATEYHSVWCAECKCEVQLNLKFLYIPPAAIDNMARGRPNLGRMIAGFLWRMDNAP